MKCLNCKGNIVIKRNLLNLFSLKKEYICDECFKNINFDFNEIILPVNYYYIRINYLIINDEKIIHDCLINEYSKIYNKLRQKNNLVLSYNKYYMSEQNYVFFEHLANHHKNNVVLLVTQLYD
ncbi:MAG: hypothetical protein R3Y60_01415 [bacterium]